MKRLVLVLVFMFAGFTAIATVAVQTRSQMQASTTSNVYQNNSNSITGSVMQQQLLMIEASVATLFDPNTYAQLQTFTSSFSVPNITGLLYGNSTSAVTSVHPTALAEAMSGSDWCAKVASAITTLPSTGGTVDARGLTGVQSCAAGLAITANVSVLVGSSTITQSGTITVGSTASLICQPGGIGIGNNFGPSRFVQANGANLQNMLWLTNGDNSAQWCVFDGNKNNNPSSGPVVAVSASHYYINKLTIQNGSADGLMLYSGASQALSGNPSYAYGTANSACCGTIENVNSIKNNGDGFNCGGTADTKWIGDDAEINAGNAGYEFNNCSTNRIDEFDVGENQIGIWVHGQGYNAGVSTGASGQIIGLGQFGNQAKQDVLFDNSSCGTYNNQIVGAQFFPSSFRTANTYASVEIIGNAHCVPNAGNIIASDNFISPTVNTLANAVYVHSSQVASATASASWAQGDSTITIGTLTGTLISGDIVYDSTTSQTIGIIASYSAPTITFQSGAYAAYASSGSSDSLIFYANSGVDLIGPVQLNGTYGGSPLNVTTATNVTSACTPTSCTNIGQTINGAILQKSPLTTYGASVLSGGATSSDSYALLVNNPFVGAYSTVFEDISVGTSAGGSHVLAERSCQRNNASSGGTCAMWTYTNSGTRVASEVYGGVPPTSSGCSTGSFVGQNTVGKFSLTANCTASTITLTFWTSAANGWNCPALNDQTTPATFPETGSNATTATFKGTGTSGDVITYGPCFPY